MDLNDNTILVYALKNYKTHKYIMSEFYIDYKKIINIKKLIGKYKTNRDLKDRLLLNNIILFYNVFETEAATRMLFYKIGEVDYPILKTILMYLNYMPDVIYSIDGKDINNLDIPIDIMLVNILRKL